MTFEWMAALAVTSTAAQAPDTGAAETNAIALPPAVRSVIDQAIASGDAAAVETIVRFSVAAHPEAEAEIRALHRIFQARLTERQQQEADARRASLAQASPLEHWDGNIEFGASRSTGTTDSLGLFGALRLERRGIDWNHRVAARAEIQETEGRRTAERLSFEWQPRLKLDDRLYAFGIVQAERDPFVGFDARYSLGLGAGYSLIDERRLRLEVEGGAAYRQLDLPIAPDRSSVSGRASLDLTWRLAQALELKQTASVFLDGDTGSGTSTTALDAALVGPLRLRLSYEMRFENDVLRQVDTTSTGSRATVVYQF